MTIKTFTGIGTRPRQEDAFCVNEKPGGTLAVVADGMGGHGFGDEASQFVVNTINEYWQSTPNEVDIEQKIIDAVAHTANCYEKNANGREMGSTLVMAYIQGNIAYVAHCGDSRIYIWHKDKNQYFHTVDHTLMSEFGYELITNAFFTDMCDRIKPEIRKIELGNGDRLMLCTDGVFKYIKPEDLRMVFTSDQPLAGVAEDLEAYCMAMSFDNFTAVLIEA